LTALFTRARFARRPWLDWGRFTSFFLHAPLRCRSLALLVFKSIGLPPRPSGSGKDRTCHIFDHLLSQSVFCYCGLAKLSLMDLCYGTRSVMCTCMCLAATTISKVSTLWSLTHVCDDAAQYDDVYLRS
jgi:hypothetical protein